MRTNGKTVILAVLLELALGAGALNGAEGPRHKRPRAVTIRSSPKIRISGPGTGTYWWAHMDISPSNPGSIMVCGTRTIPRHNSAEGYIYLSADFGKTWRQVLVDASSQWVSEHSCAFGRGGNAYFLSSRSAFYNGLTHHDQGHSSLYRSSDAGRTWTRGVDWPFVDFSSTAVDHLRSTQDLVFIFANDVNTNDPTSGPGIITYLPSDAAPHRSVLLAKDSRYGKLFSAGPTASAVLHNGAVIGAFIVLRSAQAGSRPWANASMVRESIEVAGTDDQGVSLTPPRVVSAVTSFGQLSEPTMAVDRSFGPHRGRIYLAWAQDTASHIEIMLATSDDAGKEWHGHRVAAMPDHPRELGLYASPGITPPAVAVNNQGILGLFWIENEGRCPYFATSLDGGRSIKMGKKIGVCAPRYIRDLSWYSDYLFTWPASEANEFGLERNESRLGLRTQMRVQSLTPTSMVADQLGDFHPMWIALRNGGSQLWTTTVTVNANTGIEPTLPAGLGDISSRVALQFSNNNFDAKSRSLSVNVVVVNRGNTALKGPFVVQVLQKKSTLGDLQASDKTGKICEWTSQSYLVAQQLLDPGDWSLPVRIITRLSNIRRTDSGDLNITLRVCGYKGTARTS